MTSARGSTLEEAIRIRETARQLVSPAEVRTALDRMAAAACGVLAKKNPLVLAVMNGGAFTAVELCQRMDFPHELDFVHVTRYDGRWWAENCAGGPGPTGTCRGERFSWLTTSSTMATR